MNENLYQYTLAKAKEDGLEINPAIEHKQVNGLYGMYASKHVKKGSVLARFPKKKVLKPSGKYKYPTEMAKDTRYAHTAVHEFTSSRVHEFTK